MGISAHNLRPGTIIEFEGKLWQCLEAVHKTPGNKRAFVQAKLRNVKDGTGKDVKFSSTETLETSQLISKTMQFLYSDGDDYHFMDAENYNQIQLRAEMLGPAVHYLLPETHVDITFHENTPIGIKLPQKMDFKITDAEPNLRGATAQAAYKNATIETGLSIKVPSFIEAGDVVTLNTETGEYVTRAKT